MRRTRGGDDAAFAALVRRYEAPLFNFARRMLGHGSEADDVFQETFVRVYRHRDRFDSGLRFRPWLYRIAANLCRDRRRWWKRRPGDDYSVDVDHASIADTASSPSDHARAAEIGAAIDAAVARLPEKHRAVFVMARYDGLGYDEIAAALGIPVGTVKSRMNKAAAVLIEQLREHYP